MRDNAHHRELKVSVVKALLYSDIFDYPLTAEEVYSRLSTNHTTPVEVASQLQELKSSGVVFQFGSFFSVRDESTLAERRSAGNKMADSSLPLARQWAKRIDSFPFVRGVMISGSLSKNYMDPKSDFDFFVVTASRRLWITRALLALYKRIVLGNSHRHFCANYFVDVDHLEIEEQNIFTATELGTLLPVCGVENYNSLINQNRWMLEFLPNFKLPTHVTEPADMRPRRLKSILETLINPVGTTLDGWLMRFLRRRAHRLYGANLEAADFDVAFKSRRYVSKNHVNHWQRKVIERYDTRFDSFVKEHPQLTTV